MKTPPITLAFAVAIALSCMTACTSVVQTPGASETSSADRATILPHGVRIKSVNGTEIGVFASAVEVAPGPVLITFQVDQASYLLPDRQNSDLMIRFLASRGVTYIVTGRRGDGRLCAFPRLGDGQPDLTAPAGCIGRE